MQNLTEFMSEALIQEGAKKDTKGDKKEYDAFFQKTLKKYGVTNPSKLEGADKKKFFDEIDAMTQDRETNSNDYMSGILNVLQTEMDGIEKDNKITVLAATNCPSKIDSSLLRPGRFDKLIPVSYPNYENIEQLLTKLSKNAEEVSGTKIFAENLDYSKVATDMRKYAFVDVEEIFNRTRMDKIRTLKL